MTRHYANIGTVIWRGDFRRLSGSAQRTHFMLMTQPDITAAGILPITIGRWAGNASDTTPDSIRRDIDELIAADWIAVDYSTEELLVRTFVEDDKGYTNSKRRPVIRKAAADILSVPLRRTLATEFGRLGIPADWVPLPDQPDLAKLTPSVTTDVFPQVDRLSDSHFDALRDGATGALPSSEGVAATKGLYVEAPTHNTHPPSRAAAVTAPASAADSAKTGEGEDTPESLETLIRDIRTKRPEWTRRNITKAVNDPDVRERPWPVIAAALHLVADDPRSGLPTRLRSDGPWWSAAAVAVSKREPTLLAAPCGDCDANRHIIRGDGRLDRCPTCHPLRKAS